MSDRTMKRLESKKSHSWWWDSHISPKNNKWLADNLQDMDRSVKRMLKLIEEEGDSFAKKAEMYYQKRPELIALVEEFYRMYRSLAERYDNLTGELHKGIPSELQTQGSGASEAGSESGSPVLTPDRRQSRRRSSHRAAGFDIFLGSGGGSPDFSQKAESDESSSSSSDSESESDGDGASSSSKNNQSGPPANGDGADLSRRIIELEVELHNAKEMLRRVVEENSAARSKVSENGNDQELLGRIAWYEEELNVTNEKLLRSEEEIARLRLEIQKNESSSEITSYLRTQLDSAWKDIEIRDGELQLEKIRVFELRERIAKLDVTDKDDKIEALEKELAVTNEQLVSSETEISRLKLELKRNISLEATHHDLLQVEFPSAPNNIDSKKVELAGSENSRNADMEGGVTHSLSKIKVLEEELRVRNEKLLLSEKEIARLKLELKNKSSEATTTISLLESSSRDFESLEAELQSEKRRLTELQHRIKMLEGDVSNRDQEIWELKVAISDAEHKFTLEKSQLQSLDGLRLKYDMLTAERDRLNAKVISLAADLGSRDEQIGQMDEHLHRLHMEHVGLISGCEGARRQVEEQRCRVKELEEEVERQRVVILDGAEKKREAIRQLCFSLEHYRNGYHQLRQVFMVHKKQLASPVLAS